MPFAIKSFSLPALKLMEDAEKSWRKIRGFDFTGFAWILLPSVFQRKSTRLIHSESQ
jgi:hypothetical protein